VTAPGIWLASDVHLDASHAALGDAFVRFLRERVAGAEQIAFAAVDEFIVAKAMSVGQGFGHRTVVIRS